MNRWKEKNRQVYTAITNPDAWKDEYLTAFGSASENVTYLNQLWEFDGTPADLMLTDGRHHLCGVIDVYSRRARLLVTPTAKATAVAGLLRRSILDWGLPPDDWGLTAKTDNGSDYVGHHMTRVFKNLRINQELCPPFSPWKKPHIERFFRTFSHDMVELLPGYIGHDVAERKGIEARQAFSERLFKKDQIIDVQMSSADLQAFCDEWVNNIYQHAPHDGLGGKTPFQVANEWQEPIRRITNERALDLLLAEAPGNGGVRTVGKKGIRLDNGLYIAPELWSWVGEDVLVLYDPVDFGQVSAYTLGDNPEFICVAKDPSRTGIDRAEVAAKAREMQKKAVQEARAELKKAAKKQDIDHIADEIRAAAAEKAAKIVELPKPSMEFTTPALEAASKAADVLDAPAAPRPTVDDVAFLSARLKKAQEAKQQRDAEAAAEARPETNRQKYLRWKSVDTAIAAGADVSDADRSFHRSFRQTDIYRAEKGMEEDFPEFYQAKQRQ
jgi:transposase InsO family protein